MFKYFLVLVCAGYGRPSQLFLDKEWEEFKHVYHKTYSLHEEIARKLIWLKNLDVITKHNLEADLGHHSFRIGMNEYGDLTTEEATKMLNGLWVSGFVNESSFLPPNNVKLPETIDWRKEGYVTRIKNQGSCGSCWAFSATGALEGQHFRKTGKLVSLSEQNLMDCSKENFGCSGGLPKNAYGYITKNGGIDTEESYPYIGKVKNSACTGGTRYHLIARNEMILQKAVASVGPIAVGIDAGRRSFHLYKEGVYDDDSCSTLIGNHAVLIVGYGTYQSKDYWLVKNSWGTSWGMDGYIMMSRNKDNQCGITNQAVYPTV